MSERDDWMRPGPVEVAPGVHRVPLPLPNDGLRAVNVYVVEDSSGLVLIDAGWAIPESQDRLARSLKDLGYDLADISRFLVTHIHNDHYTQAIALRRQFGTRVALGVGERSSLERMMSPGVTELAAQLQRLHECGAGKLTRRMRAAGLDGPLDATNYARPDEWLDGHSTLSLAGRRLQVVATPGHTRGHVVFVDRDAGLLFGGDHVLPHITPSIGLEVEPGELALGSYLRSLAVVRAMPEMRLLPAHGPITDSVHARVDQLLEHHQRRLDACLGSVSAGAATAYQVAQALRWTRRGRRLDELDLFNQMLATVEIAAHLDLLVAQDRLGRRQVEGIAHHYRT